MGRVITNIVTLQPTWTDKLKILLGAAIRIEVQTDVATEKAAVCRG